MRLFFFSLIFTLFSSAISAQTGNTYINFGIRNAGITVDGVFEAFTANVDINPDDLSNATFNGTIRVKSINTGISKRDKDLLKSGYFDEENFPKIIFIATSVKKLGDGKYEVSGKLKIKGVKKDHTFTVKEVKKSGVTYFEGEFSLNRRDFNVGGSSWVLSDDLIVKIRVQNK